MLQPLQCPTAATGIGSKTVGFTGLPLGGESRGASLRWRRTRLKGLFLDRLPCHSQSWSGGPCPTRRSRRRGGEAPERQRGWKAAGIEPLGRQSGRVSMNTRSNPSG